MENISSMFVALPVGEQRFKSSFDIYYMLNYYTNLENSNSTNITNLESNWKKSIEIQQNSMLSNNISK